MVRRGLAPSREQASAAVASGRVLVAGTQATKASRLVVASEPIEVLGPPARFVSRGGEKLDAALDRFGVDVAGKRALDAGSSTGGFVDCLLQRGAQQVVAIDVGRGQLDPKMRNDSRVVVLERTNVRSIGPETLGSTGPVDVLTADLSFVSLRVVVGTLVKLVRDGGDMVVLVKPQFEVGKAAASRGKGVIREPRLWLSAVGDVVGALGEAGTGIMGAMSSPIRGAAGNVEFFVHARVGAPAAPEATVASWLEEAVAVAARIG